MVSGCVCAARPGTSLCDSRDQRLFPQLRTPVISARRDPVSGPTDGNGNCGASEHSPRTSSPGTPREGRGGHRPPSEAEPWRVVCVVRGCVARWMPVLVRSRLRRHGLGGCSPASRAAVRGGPALWSERVLLLWGRGQRGTPGVSGGARNRMHMITASALEPGDLLEREVIPRADGLNWRIPDGPREVRRCGARGRIPARVTLTGVTLQPVLKVTLFDPE